MKKLNFEKVLGEIGCALAILLFFEQGRKKEIEKGAFASLTMNDWVDVFNESSDGSEIEGVALKALEKMIRGNAEERLNKWIRILPYRPSFNPPKIEDVADRQIVSILEANISSFSFEKLVDIRRELAYNVGESVRELINAQIVRTARTFEQQIVAYNCYAIDSMKEEEEFAGRVAAEVEWVELYKNNPVGSRIRKLAFENLSKTLDSNDFNAWLDVCETHREREWDRGSIGSGKRKASKKEQEFFSKRLHEAANTFEQWEKVEELFRASQIAFDKMLKKARSFDHWYKIYQVLQRVASYKYDQYELPKAKIDELVVLENMVKKAKTLKQWSIVMNSAQSGALWERAREEIKKICI